MSPETLSAFHAAGLVADVALLPLSLRTLLTRPVSSILAAGLCAWLDAPIVLGLLAVATVAGSARDWAELIRAGGKPAGLGW